MNQLDPLELDAIRIALQFHAALINQTLQKLAPQPAQQPQPPQE